MEDRKAGEMPAPQRFFHNGLAIHRGEERHSVVVRGYNALARIEVGAAIAQVVVSGKVIGSRTVEA